MMLSKPDPFRIAIDLTPSFSIAALTILNYIGELFPRPISSFWESSYTRILLILRISTRTLILRTLKNWAPIYWDFPEARTEHWLQKWPKYSMESISIITLRELWRSSCHHHLRPETRSCDTPHEIEKFELLPWDLDSWGIAKYTANKFKYSLEFTIVITRLLLLHLILRFDQ